MNAAWTAQRLRSMSAAEVAMRVRRRRMLASWRRRPQWSPPVFTATLQPSRYRLPILKDEPCAPELIAAADAQLAGEVVLLGQRFSVGHTDWHLDPQSGVTAPMEFGPLLDYRDPGSSATCATSGS